MSLPGAGESFQLLVPSYPWRQESLLLLLTPKASALLLLKTSNSSHPSHNKIRRLYKSLWRWDQQTLDGLFFRFQIVLACSAVIQ